MRGSKVYLGDIRRSIEKIERYTKGIKSKYAFSKNDLVVDAVTRNLQIIGEAVKNIPLDAKKKHPEIEWKKIAGLRDILTHAYFGVEISIIWDIIENYLPELKVAVKKMEAEAK
jgi:uncharacterized protein with HEPN domain